MRNVYFVAAVLLSAVAWICTQTIWEYQYILEYIAIFFASWCVSMVFIFQEEGEDNKKYTIFTPYNLIYIVILLVLIFVVLRNYEFEYWQEVTGSFWRVVISLNGIQTLLTILFFKIRDWYYHM